MSTFLKVISAVVVAVILTSLLPKNARDYSALIIVTICAGIIAVICSFLEPIIAFIQTIQEDSVLDNNALNVVLKVSGVSILSEVLAVVCADTGNASIGKMVQLLGTTVILWLSLPLFTLLIELIKNILTTA